MTLIEDRRGEGDAALDLVKEVRDGLQEMAAIMEQLAKPEHYVLTIPLAGNDVTIPPYAVVAIVQNTAAATLTVKIGLLSHIVPANSSAAYPTLKANLVTSAGPGNITFSSRYEDALSLGTGAE